MFSDIVTYDAVRLILGVLSLYMYRCKAAIVHVSRIKDYNKLV